MKRSAAQLRSLAPAYWKAAVALIVGVAGLWGVFALKPKEHPLLIAHRLNEAKRLAAPPMVRLTTSGHASHPLPSPDGSQLAYAETRCRNGICHSDLMIREMNGDNVDEIGAEHNKASIPASWSPDGVWVLVAIADLTKQEVIGLQIVSQRGGTPRGIAKGATSAAFVANDTIVVLSASGPPYDAQLSGPVRCCFDIQLTHKEG